MTFYLDDVTHLPQADPSDSGKAHSDVRARWDAKDPEAIAGMKQFGDIAARGYVVVALWLRYRLAFGAMEENLHLTTRVAASSNWLLKFPISLRHDVPP